MLGCQLRIYLENSRSYGANTSLAVFTALHKAKSIEKYHQDFGNILHRLAIKDGIAWPAEIPKEVDDHRWEFCGAGDPIFVVCNTLSHVLRQSRRSSSCMLTFQARWFFEKILATKESTLKSFSKVRARLHPFDAIPLSPEPGKYGDMSTREYQQYLLNDINPILDCPCSTLQEKNDERIIFQKALQLTPKSRLSHIPITTTRIHWAPTGSAIQKPQMARAFM